MEENSVGTYKRIIRSSIAEQILSKCGIYVDLNVLRAHFISNNVPKTSEIYRYMKSASQGGGYIYTRYHSKDITTSRMFVEKGYLNLITLSDPAILSSIKSRYDDGIIVSLDFKAFEPSIIGHLLGECFPYDIHTWAENLLGLSRSEVKKMNMTLLYCESFEDKIVEYCEELLSKSIDADKCFEYVNRFTEIRKSVENYISPHEKIFVKNGYIVNTFGRKIYIKESRNIFNNMVQSIGSEILVESIIDVSKFLKNKKSHILFHRFDSIYFDFSKESFLKDIENVIKIMENSGGDIKLNVGIQLGNSLNSLKDFTID